MNAKHGPHCSEPYNAECLRFSTDGSRMGAFIAHSMGTDSEEEIMRRGVDSLKPQLTGMDAEQADWDGIECTCPDGATLEEIEAVGGHWEDCPRAVEISVVIGAE